MVAKASETLATDLRAALAPRWRKRALYDMGLHGTRKGPMPYVCGKCCASGVKLWREAQTFLCHQTLTCAACATELPVDERGTIRLGDLYPDWGGDQRSDQIAPWRVPAVPSPDGSFWGYTSVSDVGVKWWRALPTYGEQGRGEVEAM